MSDTLRQALADRMRAYPNDSNMHWWADILADDIMAVVLADPTVARWKNIADAVDNEPDYGNRNASDRYHDAIYAMLRAAGKTT